MWYFLLILSSIMVFDVVVLFKRRNSAFIGWQDNDYD